MLRYIVGVSIVTTAVLILRLITDRKIARKYQYAMWLVIPVFMLMYPFVNISITLPKMPVFTDKTEEAVTYDSTEAGNNLSFANPGLPLQIDSDVNSDGTEDQHEERRINWDATLRNISLLISGCILTVLFIYNVGFVFYVVRRRSHIKTSEEGLKVFKLNTAATPFLLGRGIYISDEDEGFSRYVVCHETCHYRQGDPLWIIVRYVVLVLNWYNPLVWAAFALSGIDCELACDERVLTVLGKEDASSYGNMLLELARMHSAGSLNFTVSTGARGAFAVMKKRITGIKYPNRNNRAVLITCAVLVMIIGGCSLIEYDEVGTELSDPLSTEVLGSSYTHEEQSLSMDEQLFGEWDVIENNSVASTIGEDEILGFTFNNDNTGTIRVLTGGVETTADMTYSADGSYISFHVDGFHIPRACYTVGGDLLTIIHNGSLCLRRSLSIINAPSIGSLPDGLYTVTMTSYVFPDDSGDETCMFLPWTQYEVDRDFIDSLATGQTLDLTEWGGFGLITVGQISDEILDSETYIGTNYTGLRKSFTTDTVSFSFYQVEGSDKWKLFSSGYLPVIQQYEMMRMIIAEDCTIYDAYSLLHGDHPNMTPEEYEAVIQFRDTSLTEGVSNSISDFFDVFGYTQYDYTVIRVENNVVTEVYFWYV